MIIDLHTHTFPTSDDSFLSPERLIVEAKRSGIDGLCLTDHDGFWKPEDVDALSKQHHFPLFPGCEVTTEEGHLLVFGLERYIFGMHRAAFVKQLADKAGGVIVVAHPYRRRFKEQDASDSTSYETMVEHACQSQALLLAAAVEIINGRGSVAENNFSSEIARRSNLYGTGGSDCHKLEEIGTAATEFAKPVTCLQELIAELKGGRCRPVALVKGRTVEHVHNAS